MELVIVTGMSGAGKSNTLKFLEDLDFYCVDNLPPLLIPTLAEVCFRHGSEIDKLALGIDIRSKKQFSDLVSTLELLKYEYKIIFLEAKDNVLIKRYKETRRKHPLAIEDSIITGIKKEREKLKEIKTKATHIIDTSFTFPKELKEQINTIFLSDKPFSNLTITILSFGFKFGIPTDTDMVFDVRFIPNPFYVENLKELTGNEKEVQDYVMSHESANVFFEKLKDILDYTIPFFIKEDKHQLIISIGCTGGKHRSVTISNKLYEYFKECGHNAIVKHRDVIIPNRRI
ncbi:MAG: RNase adapter RapZ [Defluviitaleaceae bacterium]|nr:RNase adapter RapZ [Defluviitaleaceae bacterium]